MSDHELSQRPPAAGAGREPQKGSTAGGGSGACSTCYGEGTVFRDYGPETCRDCWGLGELPSASILSERRLRELEQRYERRDEETLRDVRWLIGKVRSADHALLQILAASLDADVDDPIAKKIRFLANDVLAVYPPSSAPES